MKITLHRAVAKIIDPAAFVCTPEMYGLETQAQLESQTLVGAARDIAKEKARKIIELVREWDSK